MNKIVFLSASLWSSCLCRQQSLWARRSPPGEWWGRGGGSAGGWFRSRWLGLCVANPHHGFEHAPAGRHPLELMPDCQSVMAFVVPRADIPDSLFVGLRRSTPQPRDY